VPSVIAIAAKTANSARRHLAMREADFERICAYSIAFLSADAPDRRSFHTITNWTVAWIMSQAKRSGVRVVTLPLLAMLTLASC
jgi:hypothetical protein